MVRCSLCAPLYLAARPTIHRGEVRVTMLLPEAVIAELLGAAFLAYSCAKRIGGNEGYGAAVLVVAAVLLAGIPLTTNFLS